MTTPAAIQDVTADFVHGGRIWLESEDTGTGCTLAAHDLPG